MSDTVVPLDRAAKKAFIDDIWKCFKSNPEYLNACREEMHNAVDAEYYFGEENFCFNPRAMTFNTLYYKCLREKRRHKSHTWRDLKNIAGRIRERASAAMKIVEAMQNLNAALAEGQCIIYTDRATYKSDPDLQKQITRLSSIAPIAMPANNIPRECEDEYSMTVGSYRIMCSAEFDNAAIIEKMSSPETLAFIAHHIGLEVDTEDIVQKKKQSVQGSPDAIARILKDLEIPAPEPAQIVSA